MTLIPKMSKQRDDVMKSLQASLQCILMKADVIGPEDLDINFKVKVTGSDATRFMDAVNNSSLKEAETTGNVKRDFTRCDCCRKLFKEVFSFCFIFGEGYENTCKECGPLRRSGRKRAEIKSEDKTDDTCKKISQKQNNDKSNAGTENVNKENVTNMEGNVSALCENKTLEDSCEEDTSEAAEDLVCPICKKSFSSEVSFTDHLLKHSGANSCKCAVCGGKFSNKYVLKKHVKRHVPEGKRRYKCDVCKKGFTEAFYYRDHLQTHSEVKPFQCKECSSSYSSSTALRRHIREHAIVQSSGKQPAITRNSTDEEREIGLDVEMVTGGLKDVSPEDDAVDNNGSKVDEDESGKGKDGERADHTYSDNVFESNDPSVEDMVVNKESFQTKELIAPIKNYSCYACWESFVTRSALRIHMKLHQDIGFQCKFCSKGFSSGKLLKQHQTQHSSDRPFLCDTCGKSFFSKQVMEKHSSKHTPREQWKYECQICTKKFSHISFFRDHKWAHAEEKPHKCEMCGNRYANMQTLRRHVMSHSAGTHVCTECDQKFMFAHRLKEHMYTHNGVVPFCCEVCGKGFKSHQVFKKHARIHLNVKPCACEKCPKRFYTQSDLDIHMRVHSGERPFQCDICGRTYTNKNTLKHHVLGHSEQNNVLKSCKICGKEFKGERSLSRHVQIHQPEKKFVCELCGKRFRFSKALWSHKQTHKGYKPHACNHCGKKFRSITHCKNHMKIHTGENLFQCSFCNDWFTDMSYVEKVHPKYCKGRLVYCNICGRGFIHNQALQSHLGFHTGERPFGCDTCGRAYITEYSLGIHMKRHNEAKSHVCRICNKRFNRAADLKKHENRHGNQPIKTELPNSNKQVCTEKQQEEEETIATHTAEAVSELSSENIASFTGPDTILEEVQDVIEVEQFPADHIVLATVDPGQIGQDGQYSVNQSYDLVHSGVLSHYQQDQQDDGQYILQQNEDDDDQQIIRITGSLFCDTSNTTSSNQVI